MASGAVLTYVLYDSVESMDTAFDTAQDYARVFGSFTTGSDCASGTYDGTWSMSDVEAGRLLCHALEGAASIVWSHPASRVLADDPPTRGGPRRGMGALADRGTQ